MPYPKRLIEVDLPIKRISAHARREKSIRHGHISTLHIWWARRPLAACRAVLCASLWHDPADDLCPKEFIEVAKKEMIKWSDTNHLQLLSKESIEHFIKVNHDSKLVNNNIFLRQLLLDFIADFSDWNNSNQPEYMFTSRALTQSAHIAMGGEPGTNPLVVDSFAGGGSIPLEALRVGADVFASDLNPIPVLLNKVQLEYIPKFGKHLADEIRRYGKLLKDEAEKELGEFYHGIEDPTEEIYTPQIKEFISQGQKKWKFKKVISETPIAFLWARTIQCEGPNCGAEVPLLRSTYLAKKGNRSLGFKIIPNKKEKKIDFEIVENIKLSETIGTVQRGNATCKCCGYVTTVKSVRKQLVKRKGGANDSRLLAVVCKVITERVWNKKNESFDEIGRFYRVPVKTDISSYKNAALLLKKKIASHNEILSFIPNEQTPLGGGSGAGRAFSQRNYGMFEFSDLFNERQLLTTSVIQSLINKTVKDKTHVKTLVSIVVSRLADGNSSLARWQPTGEKISNTFGRQALPMVWDYCEANPFCDATRSFLSMIEWIAEVCEETIFSGETYSGNCVQSDACDLVLPDDLASCFFTDPPYYDAVPYSDLSDFFYVWLKRSLKDSFPELFQTELTEKNKECIVDDAKSKDNKYFEQTITKALAEGRRITKPSGVGIVVFAHKTTEGWEALLQGMVDSGWCFTASWPIDSEMGSRLRAQNSAALASSVHLVCRPRENEDGSLIQDNIGDWRDVQEELPKRIHEWMPRLAEEGVAGADAIFACLGPALEIFSRYTKVVHTGSEREISLREYLEKVWAAVSQEALNMVFSGGDAQGLEEDARLTAMWLWTLTAGASDNGSSDDDEENDEEEPTSNGKLTGGFTLEYDTARKIAQGLGADLEDLKTLIEVKGNKARLLPVIERANKLFGSIGIQQQAVKKKKKVQLSLDFENMVAEEDLKYEMPELKMEQTGKTVLDRLHQAMLLFSTGRSEALKRFLVEDGAGKDDRFWKLAQSLTSLYPKDTDERRWVEAVQTYKKGLGF